MVINITLLITMLMISTCTHLPQDRVIYRLQVDATLVGQVVEDVGGPDGFWSPLLVAKYEIDPLVQLNGDYLGLQGLHGI